MRTYSSFSDKVEKVVSLEAGETLLLGSSEGYVLDSNQDVIARVSNLNKRLKGKKEYITAGGFTACRVPVYDFPMLMKEAEVQLHRDKEGGESGSSE